MAGQSGVQIPVVRASGREICVGRQPIFEKNLDLSGYELLFRASRADEAIFDNGEWATARVFWNTFVEMGLETVTDGRSANINVTPAFLLGDCTNLFDTKKIALEVSCSEQFATPAIIERIRELSRSGFRIVLDNYEPGAVADQLIDCVETVKINARGVAVDAMKAVLQPLQKRRLKKIATHVESRAVFEAAKTAGFDAFQGFFLSEPEIVVKERVPADAITRMRLLAVLNDPTKETDDLERVISQDIGISYRLLKYVNSALFSLSQKVESVRHALLLIGPRRVRSWANLIVLSAVGDNRHEVFTMAMVRSKMCELLAQKIGEKSPEIYQTAGLFSLLDVFVGRPLAEVVALLPLAEELRSAIVEKKGRIGEALKCVIDYERFQWHEPKFDVVDRSDLCRAYLDALKWTAEVRGALKD